MVGYTTTAFFISPSGKLVKQTFTHVAVNKDVSSQTEYDSITVTKPCIKVEIS